MHIRFARKAGLHPQSPMPLRLLVTLCTALGACAFAPAVGTPRGTLPHRMSPLLMKTWADDEFAAYSKPLPADVESELPDEVLNESRDGVCLLWGLAREVYGSDASTLAAVRRNSALVLPYLNRPQHIVGCWQVLNEFMPEAEVREVITKNPGVLACNPMGLAGSSADAIKASAGAVDAVEQMPMAGRWAVPAVGVLAVGGLAVSKFIECQGGMCN